MSLDKSDIKNKRKYIFNQSYKTTNIRKGDKRINSATRICAVCGRPLSKLILRTGEPTVVVDHISCKVSDIIRINICEDIRSCYAYSSKKGEN